jgi:hypothetical protein
MVPMPLPLYLEGLRAQHRRVFWLPSGAGLQLRDSTGLAPVFPHYIPGFRAVGIPLLQTIQLWQKDTSIRGACQIVAILCIGFLVYV